MNKVDPQHIQNLMKSLEFECSRIAETTTTVCLAKLPNGFSVGLGQSACVDPANFDFDLGSKFAKERAELEAENKLWELEGYLLKVTGKTSKDFE